jgi:hypothetical protein
LCHPGTSGAVRAYGRAMQRVVVLGAVGSPRGCSQAGGLAWASAGRARRVRFESGDVPPDHVDLRATSGDGCVGYRSYTPVRAPGCYVYVVDGPGMHEVIVFRALRLPPAQQ